MQEIAHEYAHHETEDDAVDGYPEYLYLKKRRQYNHVYRYDSESCSHDDTRSLCMSADVLCRHRSSLLREEKKWSKEKICNHGIDTRL